MSHQAFSLIRQAEISSLNIKIEEYRHNVTGARHLHLAADDNNNAFLVGFLTVPQDSTGVAHILEHTSLCGSRRFPVRDPFFLMMRRSLNTFMNAFTSSDWTAYPFASQNKKDFDNLLQVYLDATFFPNLDPLDFAQEGHRLEFENDDLVYKGVVFNEMKGALSSPVQRLWQAVSENVFPTITYHYNSGGDPIDIPNLTHAQLKQFHANHYHPSNAIFMTYGDRPAHDHQHLFEECALKEFKALNLNLQIPNEQRYDQPQQATTVYPVDKEEKNQTHVVLAWLLGDSTDINEVMNANLLSGVLLDNSASDLRHALESTNLGTAVSPLCGYDESSSESVFMCGLEGSNSEQAEAVEALILEVLQDVAKNGVPLEQVESVLHQIELSQREITGDGFPYGLRLIVNALSPMIHGGDPVAFLDLDSALSRLRQDCQNPRFIPDLIQRLLLDNPHRVRLVMAPDANLAAKAIAEETAKLAEIKAKLNDEQKAQIIEQAAALQARQQQEDDPEILPKVGLEDIADDLKIPSGDFKTIGNLASTWFASGTNGMVYQKIIIDLPKLEPELLEILPLFCDILTEVGIGNQDYRQTAALQAAVTGGISASLSIRGSVDDVQQIQSVFSLSGKALVRNQAKLSEILRQTLEQARFDELPRLRELISQFRVETENSVTSRGHSLVMTASSSGLSPAGKLSQQWYGLEGIQKLKQLDKSLDSETELKSFANKLAAIRDQLLQAPRQLLIVSEAEQAETIEKSLNWQDQQQTEFKKFKPEPVNQQIKQAWQTNTQVNFCSKAYPTVAAHDFDAAVLMVLGQFLSNGYLHRAIREQGGAYGGGASYDGSTGSFRFYSYRDPRLTETLEDFDQSLKWLQENQHKESQLEEAILSIIAKIDRPGSPAGEAISAFFNQLHGRTPKQRREFRHRVLQVTIEDLQRVAKKYLQAENANIAVLTDGKTLDGLAELGFERRVL
jgi:Zn-dependent M16 (insulinase) family peptidase